jgi:DNA-binding NtrC family response regulator
MEYSLIGDHPSIQKIRELIEMVSDTAFNVLILGETGTGKEVVARLLHRASERRRNTFVKVNCAALPLTLLESELFGYEKGAFTGAVKFKPGKFELASEGVIFLDEIGDMPLAIQAKLLQVLQSGDFTRLGGTRDVKVNAWVIAASNHNLDEDMKKGLFREDLYYRLNIIKIEMPPLRERKEDIPLLIKYLTEKHQNEMKLDQPFRLNGNMYKLFQQYHWPGNVRELSSMLVRLMVGDDPKWIETELLSNMQSDGLYPSTASGLKPPARAALEPSGDLEMENLRSLKILKSEATHFIEKKAIMHALNMTGWNKRQAAKLLKISYKTLFYKMENLGIERL